MTRPTLYRPLTRWLAGLLCLCLLAACGPTISPVPAEADGTPLPEGGSGANARPSATPTITATPVPSRFKVAPGELQGIQVSLWHPWTGAAGEAVEALLADFNRENEWGIRATAAGMAGFDDLAARVEAAEGNNRPDVVAAYPYQADAWTAPPVVVLDISPYLDDPVWGLDPAEQDDFYTFPGGEAVQNDRVAGLPAQYSAQVIYYNSTWAQELGFEAAPQTPAQFKEQACAAAQAYKRDDTRQNDGQGGWIISTGYSTSLGWLHAHGAGIVSAAGYTFDTPAAAQALRYLRELYEQGCAWLPESEAVEDPFAARQGLFAAGSAPGIPAQEAAFANLGSKDEWQVIPFPALRGNGVVEVYGPQFHLVKSQPARQLAAWLLVRWLASPESQARLARANAWLPVRISSLEQMGSLPQTHPQWREAAGLLANGRAEPNLASWRVVRWALSDATSQLFRSYFTLDQLAPMLELLDETAAGFQAAP